MPDTEDLSILIIILFEISCLSPNIEMTSVGLMSNFKIMSPTKSSSVVGRITYNKFDYSLHLLL